MDRQIKSGTFPTALQPMLRRKKTDLFGMWLDFNLDWDKVVCEVERLSQTKNLARKEWVAVQAKVLKSQMDEDKFKDLIRKRTEAGLYYNDDDWPSDPMERGSENLKSSLLSCLIDSIRISSIYGFESMEDIHCNVQQFNTSKSYFLASSCQLNSRRRGTICPKDDFFDKMM